MQTMKTRKLISVLLLMAMGFSSLHAYAISFLDEDHCEVREYIQEFSQESTHNVKNDICNIHHEFHIAFVLPEATLLPSQLQFSTATVMTLERHDYQPPKNFLKPPITNL